MRRFQLTLYVFLLAILGAGASESSAQWPQFRGPNGSGVDSGSGYPVAFSPTSNVIWKTAMPYGQSSPVVAGGRVYLTASDGGKLLTISLDAATGREVWRRELKPAHSQKVYHANDPASPTPAADADGVVVFFPDFGLAAYAADGKERWTMPLGPFKSFYGMSASPIIAGDLVVLLCDQRAGSFLVAVDRKTGKVRWKKDRPGVPEGWATPMVFRATADAPAQLIAPGTTRIDSYALETGESRWWMPVGSSGSMGTPVASGEMLFVTTSGGSEPNLPAFETALEKLDTDKNGQLSHGSSWPTRRWASTSAGWTRMRTRSSTPRSGRTYGCWAWASPARSRSGSDRPAARWTRPRWCGVRRRTCRTSLRRCTTRTSSTW